MNAWFDAAEPWRQFAGWTMLHVLWVGTAVALVGGAVRVACRRRTPGVKYAASLGTLAMLAATPFVVAGWLRQRPDSWHTPSVAGELSTSTARDASPPADERLETVTGAAERESRIAKAPAPQGVEAPGRVIDLKYDKTHLTEARDNPSPKPQDGADLAGISSLAPRESQQTANAISASEARRTEGNAVAPITQLVSWLPLAWIVGAPITFGWLAAGLVGSRRLRSASIAIDSGPIEEACRRIAASLGVARRVAVAACDRLAQPVLVGIVRPTILLPAAALSGWSPEELEMIFTHELAHVRRWDNLVNLCQRIVEAALFFHPAVWLVSRQVRREREECCDAVVVGRTNRPEAYASLLVSIAAAMRSQRSPSLAAASTLAGHPLAVRIRRILKLEDETMRVSRGTVGAAAALALALVASACLMPTSGGAAADETQSDAAATSSDESARITKVYPVGDMKSVDFAAWLRIIASSRDDADFSLDEFARSMAVTGPARVHEQIADYLNRDREGNASGASTDGGPGITATTREDLAVVLRFLKQDLETKLKDLEAKKRVEGVSNAEIQIAKLRNDITTFQTQILKLNESLTKLEAEKSVAVADAQSPGVLDKIVQAEVEKDPTIGMYKEQLLQLSQAIQAMQTAGRNGASAQLKRLQGQYTQTEQTMHQYEETAERQARERLEKIPNQALRAAYIMYKVKTERYLADKKSLEEKVKDAEEQIAELSVVDPDVVMLQQDIEAQQVLIDTLEKNIAEWRRSRIEKSGEKNRLTVPFPPQVSDGDARRIADDLKQAGHDAKAIREGGELFLELLTDLESPRVVFEETVVDGQRRVAARVVGKGTPPEETPAMRYQASDESGQFIQVNSAAEAGDSNSQATDAVNGAAPKGSGPFLSLEEQRVADRAYKALGWELEPLDENDMARVKQLGFEGGLRIVDTTNQNGPGQFGDLLVGLHIWPVKDFKTLEAVLARPDVAKLSPMKYYLVRFESGGGRGGSSKNRVATGRATVLASRLHRGREETNDLGSAANNPFAHGNSSENAPSGGQRTPYRLNSGDLIMVRVAGAFPDEPIDGQFLIEDEGAVALGPTYGRIDVAGLTVVEAEAAILKKLKETLQEARVQVTLVAKAGPGPAFYPTGEDSSAPGPAFDRTTGNLSTSYPPADDGTPAATYVYDGKTFAQWRSLWKSELKVERRMEAVEALAAFARAGYGREAAAAMLDVAAEYDFRSIGGSPKGLLQNRIVELLSETVSASDWVGELMTRRAADPARWNRFTQRLVSRTTTVDDATRELLLQIARDPKYGPNAVALRLLANTSHDGDPHRNAFDVLMRDALTGPDAENALDVLEVVGFLNVERWPETFDLLFHESPDARRRARTLLVPRRVSDENREAYDRIATNLLAVLDDSRRAPDHADAIRALAALARHLGGARETRSEVVSRLTNELEEGEERLLPTVWAAMQRLATADELGKITNGLSRERKLLVANAVKQLQTEMPQIIEGGSEGDSRLSGSRGGF